MLFKEYEVGLLWIKVWQFLKKANSLPPEPAVLLLGVYPREMKAYVHKNTCTRMFIVALFIIAPNGKRPRFPSAQEWVNKLVCPHSGILFYSKKK